MSELLPWLADALVVAGVVLITLSVSGMVRLPDVYMALHSAGKSTSVGIALIALAAVATLEWAIGARALLAAVLVMLTAPVSAYAIGRAAYHRGEPMRSPDELDESGALGGARDRERGDHGSSDEPGPAAARDADG